MTHVADGSLDALLVLEGVQVEVEDAFNLIVELIKERYWGALFLESSAGAKGESERGQKEQEASQDQQRQDDGSEDIHAGVLVGLVVGHRVVVVVEVALGTTVIMVRDWGSSWSRGSIR